MVVKLQQLDLAVCGHTLAWQGNVMQQHPEVEAALLFGRHPRQQGCTKASLLNCSHPAALTNQFFSLPPVVTR